MNPHATSHPDPQPGSFAFTAETEARAAQIIARYPEDRIRSAVIPLLDLAQRDNGGWLSKEAIEFVAQRLDMPPIRVYEVASFYTMFNLKPVGRYLLQVCRTTPCWLVGSDDLTDTIKRTCGVEIGETSADGLFTLMEVECLGACCNAPMLQINDDYYEDMTAESLAQLLDDLKNGRDVKRGSQTGREASAQAGGRHVLKEMPAYSGSGILREDPPEEADKEANGTGQPGPKEKAAGPPPKGPETTAGAAANPPGGTSSPAPVGTSRQGDNVTPPEKPATAEGEDGVSDDPQERAREEADSIAAALADLPDDATAEQKADAVGERPQAVDAPPESERVDLKRIKGIGPKNEAALHGIGIYHFHQIAAWSRPQVRWVGTYLSFPGRIDREDWVAQAKALAAGEETEFSQRVDRGEVASSAGGAKEVPPGDETKKGE